MHPWSGHFSAKVTEFARIAMRELIRIFPPSQIFANNYLGLLTNH